MAVPVWWRRLGLQEGFDSALTTDEDIALYYRAMIITMAIRRDCTIHGASGNRGRPNRRHAWPDSTSYTSARCRTDKDHYALLKRNVWHRRCVAHS